MIREAESCDLDAILELYLFLHEDSIPKKDEHLRDTWMQIIQDPKGIYGNSGFLCQRQSRTLA